MRLRYILEGERTRVLLRGPATEDLLEIGNSISARGMKLVGIVGYFKHILFWWSKKHDRPVD